MKKNVQSGEHLSEHQMRGLVYLRLTQEDLLSTLAHLHHCRRCREALARHEPLQGPNLLATVFSGEPPEETLGSRQVQERIDALVLQHLRKCQHEDWEAPRLLERIIGTAPARRTLFLLNQKDFHTLGCVRRLLTEARGLWRQDAVASAELARLACLVAENCLKEEHYPADLVIEARALARGYLANSLRARRKLSQAKTELEAGWEWLEKAEKSGLLEQAWLFRFQSAIYRDLQIFKKAREAAQQARRAFLKVRQKREARWMIVAEAIILAESNAHEEALQILETSKEELTIETLGKYAYWSALHLQACLLAWLGRSFEARELLPGIRSLETALGQWHFATRLDWLEALVAQGLGQNDQARTHFRRARDAFLERGMWPDAAMVMLEMAELALRQGRNQVAREVASDAGPVLAAHGIDREALMALQVFVQAAKREAVTLEVVAETQQRVKAARLKPALGS